jgi:hypothetical protein
MATSSPKHYGGSWEVGDFIREQQLNFHLGNAIKYISRCGKKPGESAIRDLDKAIHYLENEREFLRNSSARIQESIRAAAWADDFLFEAATEFDR